VTLTVSASVGSASGTGSVSVNADVNLDGGVGQCQVLTVTGTCSSSIPVTPGSTVAIQGAFGVEAIAGPSSGSAAFTADSKKAYGARFAVTLVDSTGHRLKIVSASGTSYPTK
jgi:hypothetical protein